MTKKDELNYGDEVVIPWGFVEVRGRVAEVYGPPQQRRVIVALDPELSSHVVDEPTTVSIPLTDVKKVASTEGAGGSAERSAVHDRGDARRVEHRFSTVTSDAPASAALGAMTSWIDVEAAAAYLGASTGFVRKLVLEHRIRHYKVGRLVRFDPADLDAFVRDGRVEPVPEPWPRAGGRHR